jgi:hypothetical protein
MVFWLLWIARQAKKATIIGSGRRREPTGRRGQLGCAGTAQEIRLAQSKNAQNKSVCARSPA